MADRFILLRGTPDGPVYLTQSDGIDTSSTNRDEAKRFPDRVDADAARNRLLASDEIAVAVVPDRVGPGPDRPYVHGEAA